MIKLFICISLVLVTPALWASNCGVFRVVKGQVSFQKKGKGPFKKARINKKICSGDAVKAGANSRAKIVMSGGNEINVSPETEFTIEKYQQADGASDNKALINVIYGKIRSNVKQKYKNNEQSFYRVKTKSAVAGVRGTEFLVSFDASRSQSRVITFEGQVAVGELVNGRFTSLTEVGAGQFTTNKVGSRPHPAKSLPKSELARFDRSTTIERRATTQNPSDSTQQRTPSQENSPENNGETQPSARSPEGPSTSNRTPASEGGQQNDFDNFIDQEIAGSPISSDVTADLPLDQLPGETINPTDRLPRLPNLTTTPAVVRDQILNRDTVVNIIPRIEGGN